MTKTKSTKKRLCSECGRHAEAKGWVRSPKRPGSDWPHCTRCGGWPTAEYTLTVTSEPDRQVRMGDGA